MSTLLLRLAGPMQAWGTESKFEYRRTGLEPTKSGVIGLLMAALGCRRDDKETLRLLDTLRMGVRVDRAGEEDRDFHTARTEKTSYVTYRFYLFDAVFLVGLESEDDALLARLETALHTPVFPLFLGRRSCPPTLPLSLGVRAEGLEQALRHEPCQDAAWRWRRGDGKMRLILEGADESRGPVRRLRDRPASFHPARREYGYRFQTECEPVIPAPRDEHDPMCELEGGDA